MLHHLLFYQAVAVLLVAVAVTNASVIAGGIAAGPIDSAVVITGPSGQVIRSGLAGIGTPLIAAGPLGAVGVAVPNVRIAPSGLIVPAGSGLEGQWIPDINEKLYDDGSFKPQIYGL